MEFDTRAGVVSIWPSIELQVTCSSMSFSFLVLEVQVAARVAVDSVGVLPQSPNLVRMAILSDRITSCSTGSLWGCSLWFHFVELASLFCWWIGNVDGECKTAKPELPCKLLVIPDGDGCEQMTMTRSGFSNYCCIVQISTTCNAVPLQTEHNQDSPVCSCVPFVS